MSSSLSTNRSTYFIENLGCAKNQVDAEVMISALSSDGWERCVDAADAAVIIVNSCGFIQPAKQESIDTVLEFRAQYPQARIVMTGCLSQRYPEELGRELPELAGIIGNRDPAGIAGFLSQIVSGGARVFVPGAGGASIGRDELLSLPGSAYVKVAEGCDNRCSFCAIPLIRGPLRSRPTAEIVGEVQRLLDRGIVEINLVAQDLASYGRDSGEDLISLLEHLLAIDAPFWIRLLYVYPEHFPDALLDLCAQESRLLPYFDIPFQHGSPAVLRRMGRPATPEANIDLLVRIRHRLPGAFVRSTFLVGFYGETDEDFDRLVSFQREARIDWLGVFSYSPEDGTPAERFEGRVPLPGPEVRRRRDELMRLQEPLTYASVDRLVGENLDVLVEEMVVNEPLAIGRAYAHAPDVDGAVVINLNNAVQPLAASSAADSHGTGRHLPLSEVTPGAIVRCRILRRNGLDVEAVPIPV